MNTELNFAPLFRRSIGFDRFNNLFETAMRSNDSSTHYPPYNIEKLNEDEYRLTMAIAGFSKNDVQITAQGGELIVTGSHEDKTESNAELLYKGIASRSFERKFSLADYVEVRSAKLKDGLLQIHLVRILPEREKPRVIAIDYDEDETAVAQKAEH